MFEGIIDKIISGLISLSLLLSPTIKGNTPSMKILQCLSGKHYINVKAALLDAFEHDFEAVFKSGKPIHIWFIVEVYNRNEKVYTKKYRHTVQFIPMISAWQVYHSESSRTLYLENYDDLKSDLSILECSIPLQSSWRTIEICVFARLSEIELPQAQRSMDLNLFWKKITPQARFTLELNPVP